MDAKQAERLVIEYERAALTVSKASSTIQDVDRYGQLRGVLVRLLSNAATPADVEAALGCHERKAS